MSNTKKILFWPDVYKEQVLMSRVLILIISLAMFFTSCGDDGSGVNSFEQTRETSLLVDDANSSSSVDVLPSSAMVNESSSSKNLDESSSSAESSSSEKKELLSSSAEKEKSSSSEVLDESSSSMKNENSSSSVKTAESSSAEIFDESSSSVVYSSSVISTVMSIYNATNNTLTDLRDNIVYKTVTIGDQVWMAENLNFEYQTGTNSFCYNDSEKFCNLYGRLYIEESKNNVCPENWHLPDSIEWKILFDFTGNKNEVLKANSSWSNWQNKDANGTNEYNFSVFAGGNKNRQTYSGYGTSATFWIKGSYWTVRITRINDNSPYYSLRDDFSAHAIRCIKDSE